MIKLPDDINLKNWFNSVEAGDDVDWKEPKYLSPEWHEWLHRHQLALGAWQFAIAEVQRLNATAQPVSDGCKWSFDDEGYWGSACGSSWVFNDGGPIENECNFCQKCGGKVMLAAAPGGQDD